MIRHRGGDGGGGVKENRRGYPIKDFSCFIRIIMSLLNYNIIMYICAALGANLRKYHGVSLWINLI
jgi:hypothetical protein